ETLQIPLISIYLPSILSLMPFPLKVPRDFLKSSERLFLSPRTLQDYRDKGIIPYTQIAGKILYKLSDIDRLLQENYHS
ncbi:hypothetical protein HMPREF1869_00239, partial [Bacteroidales bacterium KA00251]